MKKRNKRIMIAISVILALTALPCGAFGAVRYMPDVTAEMSKAGYWIDKAQEPDAILASPEYIKAINQELYAKAAETRDLYNWSETTFNGPEQNTATEASLTADGRYYASKDIGWWWDEENKKWSSVDAMGHIYNAAIANGIDPTATEEMPVKYAICTTRTCMQGFPTDYPLWDDATDPDFDYLYHTMIRVNEPLILKTRSADGNYYLALSAGITGWIPAKDVAICKDRNEWLDAWYTDDVLVVWDDKIYTEDSNFAPQTANRKLPMGTRLPLASEDEISGRINNRTAHNNHVVWMPVRDDNGNFHKELALIGENRKVSEGYLPLTTSNILKVALCQLGDAYGWGGMMGSEDCSGFMRDVYACFGLDLPRSMDRNNGVCKTWTFSENMSDEQKAAFISQMPPGTILAFPGHEMMYLGQENGKLYVISSVSNVRMPGDTSNTRVRGGVINTLDIWRRDNTTWLHNLNQVQVPYYLAGDIGLVDLSAQMCGAAAPGSAGGAADTSGEAAAGTVTSDRTLAAEGETVTLTASPAAGNRVESWSVTAKDAAGGTDGAGIGASGGTGGTDGAAVNVSVLSATQAQFTMPKGDVSVSVKFASKLANTLKASGKTVRLKAKKLKAKKQTVATKKALTIRGAQGKLTYAKVKINKKKYAKKFTINKKTGKITVKKGVKKGTYKMTVKVTAAGNADYLPKAVQAVVKIKVQ